MRLFRKNTANLRYSQNTSALQKVVEAFQRKVAIIKAVVEQLWAELPDLSGRSLFRRNISTAKVKSMLDVRLNRDIKPGMEAREGIAASEIYIGRQKRWQQTCGTHAANTFMGGPVLQPLSSNDPELGDELFGRMQEACRLRAGTNLPDPRHLALHASSYGEELLHALANLKRDRVILLSGLTGHYVTCIKDETGQWYLVDSARGGRKKQITNPADYLESLYKKHNVERLAISEQQVSVIHFAGENIPGLLVGDYSHLDPRSRGFPFGW